MKSKTMILAVLVVFSMNIAYAKPTKAGCESKQKTLEKQLQYAKNDMDERLISGLTRTLESLNVACEWERRLKVSQKQLSKSKNNSVSTNTSNNSASPKGSHTRSEQKVKKKIKKVQAKKKK
ncbi:DUF1090 family protein [Xenorhabdus innexi]|uniref:Protein yqjC n=1 Tax=Xenorhabdus innexi TaxID=290109 RepID=A0A1N6MQS9_9GAMM|nr:DUF1090 family protein [Xenorhabdus innexi]PHM30054.1 hypothetical protein Xinn_03572 [Xenorhabdus innexi]SIP71211.1 conserved exported hypothetical protein [Xenorhabdus innexi]